MCAALDYTKAATIVDHIVPHKGNWQLFTAYDNTQSLCVECHNRHKQAEELHGYSTALGADGWPLDPRHPANK
jgi:5-methylcytosine-specific restriction endonuclease McrA